MKKRLGAAARGRPVRCRPVTAATPQEAIRLSRRDIEQVHAALGFRTPFDRHDPRRFALRILNSLLGENMSSRLFQVVREKHGLAYSVHSSYQLFDDTGMLMIAAGLDTARADRALRLIARELERVRRCPAGAAELRPGSSRFPGRPGPQKAGEASRRRGSQGRASGAAESRGRAPVAAETKGGCVPAWPARATATC